MAVARPKAHYRTSRIELYRVPVRDFDPVDLREKLPECVRALEHLLAASHSVYLHCTIGATRSPTVAVAYFHWCQGWDLDEAATYEGALGVLAEYGGHSTNVGGFNLGDVGRIEA